MFFIIGSRFMNKKNLNDERLVKESIKLSSLYLYISRILQPIFENDLVFATNFQKDDKMYPNIGSTERKRLKLEKLLDFIKVENDRLKDYDRKSTRQSISTLDTDNQLYQERLDLESIIYLEVNQIDYIKAFVLRCILALNFVDEISKNPDDFADAMKELYTDFQEILQEIQFKDLTKDVSVDQALKSFTKKILEVKSEKLVELKDVKFMCENWHK